MPDAPTHQELPEPASFVLPGGIIIAFGIAYATFRIVRLHGFRVDWTWVTAVYLALWLAFALAFGLVATRCGKAQRRISIVAWLTSAAASARALHWGFLLVGGAGHEYSLYVSLLTGLALLSFGFVTHRAYRWWWSVPASIAGFLDARLSAPAVYRANPYLGLIWLIPLVILGIAMCRTRTDAADG